MGKVERIRSRSDVLMGIGMVTTEGEQILNMPVASPSERVKLRSRYLSWEAKTSDFLDSCFSATGILTQTPKSEFVGTGTALPLFGLKLTADPLSIEQASLVKQDINEKHRVLASIADRLDLFKEQQMLASLHGSTSPDGPIFLVHGHDTATREEVRRFLEGATGRRVIVLADQPNQGRDLLGKLLAHAESASYSVVLLTADDEGGKRGEAPRPRARQNVIFELGLFVGLLGRERVAALHTPSIELPTDFLGVAYIDLTHSWQIELAKELNAAGIEASVDRILQ